MKAADELAALPVGSEIRDLHDLYLAALAADSVVDEAVTGVRAAAAWSQMTSTPATSPPEIVIKLKVLLEEMETFSAADDQIEMAKSVLEDVERLNSRD